MSEHHASNIDVRFFFTLESILLQAGAQSLTGQRKIEPLLRQFAFNSKLPEPLIKQAAAVHKTLSYRLGKGHLLTVDDIARLLAWLMEARSLLLEVFVFSHPADFSSIDQLYRRLLAELASSEEHHLQRFQGFFIGASEEGVQGLRQLSELGVWSVTFAHNSTEWMSDSEHDVVELQVSLDTGLALDALQRRLPEWRWLEDASKGYLEQSVVLNKVSSWADWLHVLASERELWRDNRALVHLYDSLQGMIQERYRVALDDLLQKNDRPTGLGVVGHIPANIEASSLSLYGGCVYLLNSEASATHVFQLAETALPVYILRAGKSEWVMPAFRFMLSSQQCNQPGSFLRWSEQGWLEVEGQQTALSLYAVESPDGHCVWVELESVQRLYGVVLQASCLPKSVQNIWRIRDRFVVEPKFHQLHFSSSIIFSKTNLLSRPFAKTFDPIQFELNASNGFELYADQIFGVLPIKSIEYAMPGFVYYCGQLVPFIQPYPDHCTDEDVVIFVQTRFMSLCFRGRYAHKARSISYCLIEGSTIQVEWLGDSFRLAFATRGWVLLDQSHVYLLRQKLLERLE